MPGVATRGDLRARGLSDVDVARLVRRGRLRRVARDRYVNGAEPPPHPVELAVAGGGVALCGPSAAAVWGLPCQDERLHLLVPAGGRNRRPPAGTVLHETRRFDAVLVEGVPVTTLARTVADLAAGTEMPDAVAALDAALRTGLTRHEVLAELGRRAPGNRRARRAIALADPRAESPLESRLRLLLTLAGLPPEDLQHEVREQGRFVARVDLWYSGIVVEADGFAFHADRAAYRADRRKALAFARLGLVLLRFTWEDVLHAPEAVVSTVRVVLARPRDR